MCKVLSVLKVDTVEIFFIPFVGKRVCAMLTVSIYVTILVKKVVIEGSTIAHIEKSDPLSSDSLKRTERA